MQVFVTGATGYIGSRLLPALIRRGHHVSALTRPQSAHRLAPGCRAVVGDALDAASYAQAIDGADALIHLVGVPHPSPAKAPLFRSVDLASAREAVAAALAARVKHFVYLVPGRKSRFFGRSGAFIGVRKTAGNERSAA